MTIAIVVRRPIAFVIAITIIFAAITGIAAALIFALADTLVPATAALGLLIAEPRPHLITGAILVIIAGAAIFPVARPIAAIPVIIARALPIGAAPIIAIIAAAAFITHGILLELHKDRPGYPLGCVARLRSRQNRWREAAVPPD
jgi:hypothetical protein